MSSIGLPMGPFVLAQWRFPEPLLQSRLPEPLPLSSFRLLLAAFGMDRRLQSGLRFACTQGLRLRARSLAFHGGSGGRISLAQERDGGRPRRVGAGSSVASGLIASSSSASSFPCERPRFCLFGALLSCGSERSSSESHCQLIS